jgi:hypothetical protein
MIDDSVFEKVVAQLEESLSDLDAELSRKDAALRRQFRAATIQAFEWCGSLRASQALPARRAETAEPCTP